jgi:hypothetical protein
MCLGGLGHPLSRKISDEPAFVTRPHLLLCNGTTGFYSIRRSRSQQMF